MKKFLLVLLILLFIFGGFVLYDTKFKDTIAVLDIEEKVINIDKLFIYGTHLNMEGNIISDVQDENLQLVLYNGNFIEKEINIIEERFNLSDYVNEGIYLDDIPIGNYYLFLREKIIGENEEEVYKYYALNNTTQYKETIYYTFSNINNKIVINSEDSYPTMMINVTENNDTDIYDIVIDPGHGGIDGGASRYGYSEADFTLTLATKLKEKLESYGMKVKLTHNVGELGSNDRLEEYGEHGRAVISSEVKAKYLFSLHMNSNAYASVNGLEVYTANNINYDLAKNIVNNITSLTGLGYSNNKINKIFNGIYTRTFTQDDVNDSINDYQDENLIPYDITTNSNYYYIIRETGGIITGAYVDDRNEKIVGNPYVLSNVGTEAYLLELGYISNKNNLDNMINNIDKYVEAIAISIKPLYIDNK